MNAEAYFSNVLLGKRMKVNERQGIHSIAGEELLNDFIVNGDLLHVLDLVEDVSDLQRQLEFRSSLCEDQNVSGWAAKGKDVFLTDDVKSNEAEVIHIGKPLFSGFKRHVHWVSLDPFFTVGLVKGLPDLNVVVSPWQLDRGGGLGDELGSFRRLVRYAFQYLRPFWFNFVFVLVFGFPTFRSSRRRA